MPTIGELYAYPGLQLKIRRGKGTEIGALLRSGDIDLAIAGPLGASWERLDHWPLFAEPIELAFNRGHMLARRNEIEMRHLSGERLLGFTSLEVAEDLSERLHAHGLGGGTAHQVETDDDLLALVESNVGIGFVPASATESPDIRRQIIKGLDLERVVSVFAVAGRQRAPVVTTLLNLLRAADWPYREPNRSP